ncbi:TetR/AcrR family transcriptional regulator [Bifidobacterium adolescentis]|uniref:TetR/AcrR family transcriptional regulator n=1 Tax=Bifidobacterium adolescentis TaxID=1680 RepID=UPI0022E110A9|nr:TetR/AcrR family transcriptional regulator [Bifidobacterium adolescentis]
MAEEETSKRTRKSPQERRAEVLDAAVQLISERGFNGISIQDVADRVGISKQGVLRYVENKDKMLALVYDEYYGQTGTPEDFFSSGMPGSDPSAPHFPAYLHYLVKHNSRRRMMVQLFTVLSAESLNPDHPLHDEFMERMDGIWEHYSKYPWVVPPQLGAWADSMRPVVRKAMEIMDGIQLWWLREPEVDLCAEWAEMENLLFPEPLWDAYR